MNPSHDAPPVFTRYGFSRTGNRHSPLELEPYPAVCSNGALRATVLASAIDLVGGIVTREAAGTDVTFTTDLSLRIPRPGVPKRVVAHATPLRVGRKLVTTHVALHAETGIYASGETTFLRVPREAPRTDGRSIATPETLPFHPLDRPLDAAVGVTSVEEAGVVVLPLHPGLLNPEGTLQGALVALVVECAALDLADRESDAPQALTEMDLRYLAAASVGPVIGRATWVGAPESGMLRVALRDAGRDDRLTATAFARVQATRGPGDDSR